MARHEPRTSQDYLQVIAESLLLELPAVDEVLEEAAKAAASSAQYSCGITYLTGYGALTVASSDETASAVDELQYATGDGPCLQALRTGEPVWVDDVLTETRWGTYPRLAAEAGIRSSMSYPVIVDGESIGALNLYCADAGPCAADRDAAALLLSHHVAGILGAVRGIALDMLRDPETARAFRDRHDLDIATGIVMAQQGCSDTEARDIITNDAARRGLLTRSVVTELLGRPEPDGPT